MYIVVVEYSQFTRLNTLLQGKMLKVLLVSLLVTCMVDTSTASTSPLMKFYFTSCNADNFYKLPPR